MKGARKDLEIINSLLLRASELLSKYKKDYLEPEGRGRGICPYNGYEVHPSIFIDPGVLIRVNTREYTFTGGEQWAIVNRFLRSLREGFDNTIGHFPVEFTTQDRNKCKLNCLALINDFVERQPAAVRVGNIRYEKRARFKIEELM